MIPRLFKAEETNFDNIGYGGITRAFSCNVTEELNGTFELHMSMLVDDPLFEFVQVGNIIVAQPNMMSNPQAFVIEDVSKEINGEVEVYGTHIAQHRTKLIPIPPFGARGVSGVALAFSSIALEANPFTFITDSTSTTDITDQYPKSMREVMGGTEGSILDVFGGEYEYDNWTIYHRTRRGRETDARVMYGHNMTDFTHDETFSWNNSATGVYPYWYNEEEGIRTGDVQYSIYKDLFPYHKTVTVDFTEKFEHRPTKGELEAYALSWINAKGLPATTLKCAFNQFDSTNVDLNTLGIGDSVTVINAMYGVNYESRIVAMDYDVLANTYNSITVGSLKETIWDAISGTVAQESAGGGAINYYGACTTAGGTAQKDVTIDNFPQNFYAGLQVAVRFANANTVANPTLSINGGTAIAIKRYGTTAPSTSSASSWNAGSVVMLIYDGTYWVMNGWINTTYSSMTEAEITAGTGTTARIITPARLKTAIQTWALDDADMYKRSSAGGLDWTNQTEGDSKVIAKSALAYWNGTYSGTNSNLSRCTQGQIIGRNQICYANSIVSTFDSNGKITIPTANIGVTTGAKPVGILLTPQYSSDVVMKYHYDSSDADNVLIYAWSNGAPYVGTLRFFMVVFQTKWETT